MTLFYQKNSPYFCCLVVISSNFTIKSSSSSLVQMWGHLWPLYIILIMSSMDLSVLFFVCCKQKWCVRAICFNCQWCFKCQGMTVLRMLLCFVILYISPPIVPSCHQHTNFYSGIYVSKPFLVKRSSYFMCFTCHLMCTLDFLLHLTSFEFSCTAESPLFSCWSFLMLWSSDLFYLTSISPSRLTSYLSWLYLILWSTGTQQGKVYVHRLNCR